MMLMNLVADMLMLLAVLAVLPLRFARSRRDEERLAAELESARTVQQVLISTEIPRVSGFNIQCVYKPAGHVGGDFFQIIPIASGGPLNAIGDVSGKGMPAAMTVTLLVETLRTLAHFTQSPSEILDAMNRRMLARSQEGFTTCLVLRVAPDFLLLMTCIADLQGVHHANQETFRDAATTPYQDARNLRSPQNDTPAANAGVSFSVR